MTKFEDQKQVISAVCTSIFFPLCAHAPSGIVQYSAVHWDRSSQSRKFNAHCVHSRPDAIASHAFQSAFYKRKAFPSVAETGAGIGNTAVLNKINFGDMPAGSEDLMNKMYHSRNIKMAEKSRKLIDSGKKCFVVVGFGHLIGEKSVIDLLEKSGLQIEQM